MENDKGLWKYSRALFLLQEASGFVQILHNKELEILCKYSCEKQLVRMSVQVTRLFELKEGERDDRDWKTEVLYLDGTTEK